ncbi:endonuclease [Neobacillus sp. NPDC058068]|uniref:endonuclease n=1 Tax=Neobacillus sp. NPDC058068 TaxID=3346325 RepID=UPI0036DD8919
MEYEISSRFHSQICGKLLGDGCITKQLDRKPRFQYIHKLDDYDWANYCYLQLKDFIPLNPPKYKRTNDDRVRKGFTESYVVQSRTSNIITELEKLWYPERVKRIPFSYLESYLNDETLAWWYQDDGHLKMSNGIPRKIILSTDNFTTNENHHLQALLNDRFSLHFSLDGQNRLLLYDQPQILYFNRLTNQYMNPSMKRKIININKNVAELPPKISTFYLPVDIQINKPTLEINQQLNVLPYLYKIIISHDSYIDFYKNRIVPLRKPLPTKTYKIMLNPKHWHHLNLIKKATGLTYSNIVYLCFRINPLG